MIEDPHAARLTIPLRPGPRRRWAVSVLALLAIVQVGLAGWELVRPEAEPDPSVQPAAGEVLEAKRRAFELALARDGGMGPILWILDETKIAFSAEVRARGDARLDPADLEQARRCLEGVADPRAVLCASQGGAFDGMTAVARLRAAGDPDLDWARFVRTAQLEALDAAGYAEVAIAMRVAAEAAGESLDGRAAHIAAVRALSPAAYERLDTYSDSLKALGYADVDPFATLSVEEQAESRQRLAAARDRVQTLGAIVTTRLAWVLRFLGVAAILSCIALLLRVWPRSAVVELFPHAIRVDGRAIPVGELVSCTIDADHLRIEHARGPTRLGPLDLGDEAEAIVARIRRVIPTEAERRAEGAARRDIEASARDLLARADRA